MGIKYLSGFRGADHAKQHLRRSVHLGSALTSGYTVLNPAEAFDQQACFVYLNGALLKEGTSGAGGDYVLTGTNTITFNTAVATTDAIEVISYAFQNPTLPQTMKEVDHTVTSANETYHATDVTGGTYTASSDTLGKSSHGLAVDDVISVTSQSGTGTISVFGYQMKFDLKKGFPLVTTKKLHLRSIIYELIWFINGETNINYLKENGVSIWDEWADENGDLGPIYGAQWRNWNNDGIDQLKEVISSLKNNPSSRRMIVTAWNPNIIPNIGIK